MRKQNGGYIVIETILAFIPFTICIICILSLINVVVIQARVHNAMTQAATAISMYSYTLEVTGIAGTLNTIGSKASEVQKDEDTLKKDVNEVISGIQSLKTSDISGDVQSISGDAHNATSSIIDNPVAGISQLMNLKDSASSFTKNIQNIKKSANQVYQGGKNTATDVVGIGKKVKNDPKGTAQNVANYGINEGLKWGFSELVRPLIGRYLAIGNQSGDEYLKTYGVVGGLSGIRFYDFSTFNVGVIGNNDTTLLDENDNIKIVAEYDIENKFTKIKFPYDKIHIVQVVKTKAWRSGSDFIPE